MNTDAANTPSPEQLKPRVQRILVATDFSLPAERAVAHAVKIARKNAAELVILHVGDTVRAPQGCTGKEYLETRGHCRERVKTRLTELVEKHAGSISGFTLSPLSAEGTPSREIIRIAHEHDADLIVMANSGHNGLLHRAFLGSTVSKVVRYATCSVLVVREKEREIPEVI